MIEVGLVQSQREDSIFEDFTLILLPPTVLCLRGSPRPGREYLLNPVSCRFSIKLSWELNRMPCAGQNDRTNLPIPNNIAAPQTFPYNYVFGK